MAAQLPKVLVCRISWMRHYRGLTDDAVLVPAGRFPKENGWGGECWNFRACRGRMYGYARVNPRSDPAPVVRRLNAGTVAESVDGVTVVWVAHEGAMEETYVLGWFEHATVFAQFRNRPDSEKIAGEASAAGVAMKAGQEELRFFVTCPEGDARLLAETERQFPVRTGKGWMASQSLLFYPDGGSEHERFKSRLLNYIAACASTDAPSPDRRSARVEPDDGHSTVEGRQMLVTHVERERDPSLVKQAKRRFRRKHGGLFCEVCGFDFQLKYGSLGKGFIEAHHVTPLAAGPRNTGLDDLMMLCPNCHRMVHRQMDRKRRPLTRAESAAIVEQGGDG